MISRHRRTHERTDNGEFGSFEEEDEEEYEEEGDDNLDEEIQVVDNSQQSNSLDEQSPSSAENDDGGYAPSSFHGVDMNSGRGNAGMMAAPSQLIGAQRGYVG